jgi:hypothetical protein
LLPGPAREFSRHGGGAPPRMTLPESAVRANATGGDRGWPARARRIEGNRVDKPEAVADYQRNIRLPATAPIDATIMVAKGYQVAT